MIWIWIVKLCAWAYNSPVNVQMNGNLNHCCLMLAWLPFCKFFMPWLHLYTFHQLFPFHPLANTQFHFVQFPNLCAKQTKIPFSSVMFVKCLWMCKCSFICCICKGFWNHTHSENISTKPLHLFRIVFPCFGELSAKTVSKSCFFGLLQSKHQSLKWGVKTPETPMRLVAMHPQKDKVFHSLVGHIVPKEARHWPERETAATRL